VRLKPSMRRVHRAGEKAFLDYSGKKPRLVSEETGEVREVELFVMVLGASNYTYAEATRTQSLPDFVGATIRGFESDVGHAKKGCAALVGRGFLRRRSRTFILAQRRRRDRRVRSGPLRADRDHPGRQRPTPAGRLSLAHHRHDGAAGRFYVAPLAFRADGRRLFPSGERGLGLHFEQRAAARRRRSDDSFRLEWAQRRGAVHSDGHEPQLRRWTDPLGHLALVRRALGNVWECYLDGRPPVRRADLGRFSHEAVAVDPSRRCLYMTEDQSNGRFYRHALTTRPASTAGGVLVRRRHRLLCDQGRQSRLGLRREHQSLGGD
jgi:hypothetical protein